MLLSPSASPSALSGACPALLRRLERVTAPVAVLLPDGRPGLACSPVRSDGRVAVRAAFPDGPLAWMPVRDLA